MLSTFHIYGSLNKQNDAVTLALSGATNAAIQLSGTWVGTITFEATIDGVNYFAIDVTPIPSSTTVTTATGNGQWKVPYAGLALLRARFSAYVSGSAQATLRGTEG